MKGIEHFREAENRIQDHHRAAEQWADGLGGVFSAVSQENLEIARLNIECAQVHAILAAATAVSNLVTVWGDIAAMMRADSELADAEPPRAEPLVTCDQRGESGLLRCMLPVGHDGQHADKNDLGTIRWSQDSAETFESKPPCNAAPADDGPERCHLAIGHDGLHEHDAGGGRIVSWSTSAELRTIQNAPPVSPSIYQSTATDLHMEMPR